VPRHGEGRGVVRGGHRELGHQVRAPAAARRLRLRAALCAVDPGANAQVLGLTATPRARQGQALNSAHHAGPPSPLDGEGHRTNNDGQHFSRRDFLFSLLITLAARRRKRTPWRRSLSCAQNSFGHGLRVSFKGWI